MILDSHVHVGHHFGPSVLPDLAAAARRLGVERLLVSALGRTGFVEYPSVDDLRAANEQAAEAASYDPLFAGMVYCSGEHPRESLDEMRRYIRDGSFVGVKLWISRRATDAGCDPIFHFAAELGAPVLQHAWFKAVGQFTDESTPTDIAEAARRHPGTVFQMAHLYGSAERGVDAIAPCQNVVVDTSGSDAEAGMLSYAVSVLGAQRVLYGSDAPGRDMSVQLAKIERSLDPVARGLVLGGNVARLYGRLEREQGFDREARPNPIVLRGGGESTPHARDPEAASATIAAVVGVPFVDCSAFLGRWLHRDVPLTDAASLETGLRSVGVTHALVSPLAAVDPGIVLPANQAMVAEIGGNPFFSAVPVLDPVRSGAGEVARWLRDVAVPAIRLFPGAHGYVPVDAKPLVDAATARGKSVIVQMKLRDQRIGSPADVVPEPTVAEVLALVRACPGATIVVAAANAAQVRELLGSGERLWCDLSHAESQDVLRHLVADLGPERLLCGTHAPILIPGAMAARLEDSGLAPAALALVAHGNAVDAGLITG